MLELKLPTILDHIKKEYSDAEIQEEHKQIALMLKLGEKEEKNVPLFIGVLHDTVVQMIAYLPYELKKDAAAEVGRFLHLLNKQLDVPGFGMDEESGLIFYRVVIPCLKPELEGELLDAYIRTIKTASASILEGIDAAANDKSAVASAARVHSVASQMQPKKV
jgi:hypothetical protein